MNDKQNIPASSIKGGDQLIESLSNMSDDEYFSQLRAAADTLSFEEQAEFWRAIGEGDDT